jgi:hypothetical protein
MADDYAPLRGTPRAVTMDASAPIQAGQCVRVSGHWTVAPTHTPTGGDPDDYMGVAGADAELAGMPVTVLCGSGVIHTSQVHGDTDFGTPITAAGGGGVAEWDPAAPDVGHQIGISVSAAADAENIAWLAFR